MRPRQVPPPPELSDAVQCLWMADRTFSAHDPSFELLPDHNIELILSFGGKAWIESKGLRRDLPNVYVLGLLDQPMRYGADGRVRTVAARFHAWGFAPLFGLDWRALPRPLVIPDVDWRGLLRDTELLVDHHIEADGWLAALCTFKGTAPDGRAVAITGTIYGRIADGKILEAYNHFDFLGLFTQLGLLPPDVLVRCLAGKPGCAFQNGDID